METFIVNNMEKRSSFKLPFYMGLFIIGIFVALLLLSFVYPVDPTIFDMKNKFSGPTAEHPFGTDQFGRDVMSRIMYSMRSVFSVGIGSVTVGAMLGIFIGSLAGLSNKFIERIAMSLIDGLIAFPGILLAMIVVFVLGKGVMNSIVAIGILMIPSYARLTYSVILENKEKLYVKAARSYGMGNFEIIKNHIFPDLLPKLIIQLSSSIGGAIMIESSLSFLGLGVQPPNASLGLMLKEAREFVLLRPFMVVPAGVCLLLLVLGFNLVGDFLNDNLLRRKYDE